jgi:ribonuclease HII
VILDPAHRIEGLRDSKLLTAVARERLAAEIRDHALAWAVAIADVAEIDALNILAATLLAMRRAIESLSIAPPRPGSTATAVPTSSRASRARSSRATAMSK